MATRGTVPARTSHRVRQCVDLGERHVLDPLDDQLGDAITPGDVYRLVQVVVNQQHLDLATVTRIDRAGGVHHGQSVTQCQTGAWVDERGETGRQGDCDPRRDEVPLSGLEGDVDRRDEIGSGIVRVGVGRQGHVVGEPADLDLGHVATILPRPTIRHSGGVDHSPARHDERLTASLPWWLAVLFTAACVGWLLLVATSPAVAALVALACAAALGAGLWRYGNIRVTAEPSHFRAGDAVLTDPHLGTVEALGPDQWRAALDRAGTDRAFLLTRPWIDRGVRVAVDDPSDPTPYWIVSSRRPDALTRAVGQTGPAHDGRNDDGQEEARRDDQP